MNLCLSSSTHTLTPSSTGTPALPLLIHSVCVSKIEKTFSACGIASPRTTRRLVWSIWRIAHEPFEVPHVVRVLPPITELMLIAPLRCQRDDFAHRVVQQVDIGGVMHIRFNHKGVATPTQRFGFLFFYQNMTRAYDNLIDLIQQFRREKANVIFECLIVVRLFIKRRMP